MKRSCVWHPARAILVTIVLGGSALIPSLAGAGIQVQDSPLYRSTLRTALADLREAASATTRWRPATVGKAVVNLAFGSPALAADPGNRALTNQTIVGDPTRCDARNGFTQCDKGSESMQACWWTVQAPRKTQCGGASDRTACKNSNGTRCPGDGSQNKCSTTLGNNLTDCWGGPYAGSQYVTLANQEPSECGEGNEQNICATVGPDEKTFCKDGNDGKAATLCKKEATGCTKGGVRFCSTVGGTEKTKCSSTDQVTECVGSNTTCTGDKPDNNCDNRTASLDKANAPLPGYVFPTSPSGSDKFLAAVVENANFFGAQTPTLTFVPPGPVVQDAVVYSSDKAYFHVAIPDPPAHSSQAYQVFVSNGTQQIQLPELVVNNDEVVPGAGRTALVILVMLLMVAGSLILWRRRPAGWDQA